MCVRACVRACVCVCVCVCLFFALTSGSKQVNVFQHFILKLAYNYLKKIKSIFPVIGSDLILLWM